MPALELAQAHKQALRAGLGIGKMALASIDSAVQSLAVALMSHS